MASINLANIIILILIQSICNTNIIFSNKEIWKFKTDIWKQWALHGICKDLSRKAGHWVFKESWEIQNMGITEKFRIQRYVKLLVCVCVFVHIWSGKDNTYKWQNEHS